MGYLRPRADLLPTAEAPHSQQVTYTHGLSSSLLAGDPNLSLGAHQRCVENETKTSATENLAWFCFTDLLLFLLLWPLNHFTGFSTWIPQ